MDLWTRQRRLFGRSRPSQGKGCSYSLNCQRCPSWSRTGEGKELNLPEIANDLNLVNKLSNSFCLSKNRFISLEICILTLQQLEVLAQNPNRRFFKPLTA